jgi:hypothetical protein
MVDVDHRPRQHGLPGGGGYGDGPCNDGDRDRTAREESGKRAETSSVML